MVKKAAKQGDGKKPLVGPICPNCETPMRRRRYWCRWDRVHCSGCGESAECVSNFGGDFAFAFNGAGRRVSEGGKG
jgi:hypothetical protein